MTKTAYKYTAFTLFEILIALVIFAILGIIVAVGLRRTLAFNQRADQADKRIQQLDIAQALIRHDITAIINRPITGRNGQMLPAVQLKPGEIEFTRGGVINPFGVTRRSDLQRIDYAYRNGAIIRTTWPTLDRMTNTVTTNMTLLKNVSNFTIKAYDQNNKLQPSWPYNSASSEILNTNNQQSQSDLPKAIYISFSIAGQGSIEDIIPIPSRGLPNQTTGNPNVKPIL